MPQLCEAGVRYVRRCRNRPRARMSAVHHESEEVARGHRVDVAVANINPELRSGDGAANIRITCPTRGPSTACSTWPDVDWMLYFSWLPRGLLDSLAPSMVRDLRQMLDGIAPVMPVDFAIDERILCT